MANGDKSGVPQVVSEINEAVAKPVAHELGEGVKTALETVVTGPKVLTPEQKTAFERKRIEDANRLQGVRRRIDYLADIDSRQRGIAQLSAQKNAKIEQEEQGQKVRQFQIKARRKEDIALVREKTKTERLKSAA